MTPPPHSISCNKDCPTRDASQDFVGHENKEELTCSDHDTRDVDDTLSPPSYPMTPVLNSTQSTDNDPVSLDNTNPLKASTVPLEIEKRPPNMARALDKNDDDAQERLYSGAHLPPGVLHHRCCCPRVPQSPPHSPSVHSVDDEETSPQDECALPSASGRMEDLDDELDCAPSSLTHSRDPNKNHHRPSIGSIHFGDMDFEVEEEVGDASWPEVVEACCCHTPREWAWIGVGILAIVFFLYLFLLGLELLSSGASVMSGCRAGSLFGDDDSNPVACVMVGILATVLLQSSSTTTSIIVSLVGDSAEGTGSISVSEGIYMVMGANIGTSVTNTIVAMGHASDADQLERAFAGATLHDLFNFMSVAVLLPLEVITGYLETLTGAIVKGLNTKDNERWEGPVRHVVTPLGDRIIISNANVTRQLAQNRSLDCNSFYPMDCGGGTPTYTSCGGEFGLIACSMEHNFCPAFFTANASAKDDKVSGGVVFFIALVVLFASLLCMVATLQKLLFGMSTRIVYRATDVNGYVAILIGTAITTLVQSSSITTSTLTPLVGMGALRLEQMYPLTLGANLGTTVTSITAAMVADTIDALQVALAHLFFNLTGILIFYPVPFMRKIPLYAARKLGKATRLWRGFPLIYVAVMFVVVPLVSLGISALFGRDSKGFTVLGVFLVIIIVVSCLWLFVWCQFQDGDQACAACMIRRERKRIATRDLADNMEYVMSKLHLLMEHTGLPEDAVNDNNESLDEFGNAGSSFTGSSEGEDEQDIYSNGTSSILGSGSYREGQT